MSPMQTAECIIKYSLLPDSSIILVFPLKWRGEIVYYNM